MSEILIWIFSAFINVVMQELLVRGYLFQMLKYGITQCSNHCEHFIIYLYACVGHLKQVLFQF